MQTAGLVSGIHVRRHPDQEQKEAAEAAVEAYCAMVGERVAECESEKQTVKAKGWNDWVNDALEGC